MRMEIRKGTPADIDEIAVLYDTLNDYLESHTNYPGWKKGIYPIREDADAGIAEDSLFVAIQDGRIAGTVILNHHPEEAYRTVDWHCELADDSVLVIHTLAVHPEYLHSGIGCRLVDFAVGYATRTGMKALRLDVYEKNTPAIRLYEQSGFQYIGMADLGYGMHGLNWFRLYQLLIDQTSVFEIRDSEGHHALFPYENKIPAPNRFAASFDIWEKSMFQDTDGTGRLTQ